MIWGSSLEQPSLPSGGDFSTGSAKLALTVSAEQTAGMHDAFSFDVDITAFLEDKAVVSRW
jgi:hypothetical protein